ncbi:MAG: threonine-phosphate decarboxylase [Gammaproteobacteria bacterium]|nr:threonine-phosphate decarboxylase [Gammaproteobacteria bacterium]
MLPHGGRLRAAAAQYRIPLADWLDLSTGINPNGWPIPLLPSSLWARLPEDDDELEPAARAYYGTDSLLPVAGSQAAIQALPLLRARSRIGVLAPSYAEHAHAWRRAGHEVIPISAEEVATQTINSLDVLLLVQPNNPTGARFAREQLLTCHRHLAAGGGWLIVDEAFIDATPEQSLTPLCAQAGLVVLRSLGKFFGLAGARVGFVSAEAALLDKLKTQLGPWTVPAPSRWIATRALNDRSWHEQTRRQLVLSQQRLTALLQRHALTPAGGCALFQWLPTARAAELHDAFAQRGILTRLFEQPASLRFGLPGTEADWVRLDQALADISPRHLTGTGT